MDNTGIKNTVIIKSYKNGLAVYLDADIEFQQLYENVSDKFKDSARFFGDMRVAVSFEGRKLSSREENLLVDAITRNSSLNVVCVVGKDEKKDQMFQNTIETFEKYFPKAENAGQFYRGSIKNGQILETEGSIVVIGDVEEGCSVISAKDIIVLGRLAGNAYAGGDRNPEHFVAALEMTPSKLKIGDFKYKTKEKSKWSLKSKKDMPSIAFVKDDKVQMQAITNELLDDLII